ncbi:MAG: SAP domain-containing protein [Desulfobacteraceae bacterium]|nr:SAP domain-containing protein [Desulfobacteraceae bacterium]MBU4055003.1 SAP domain-containing protein [Pseudomonadota bacterium]
MNINQVRQAAKQMNVKTVGMNKTDIIRAVQRAEHTYDCFATQRVDYCNENKCLWREDCFSANSKKPI